MAHSRVEVTTLLAAGDGGQVAIDFGGVRVKTDDDGVETVEELTRHEAIGLMLRALSMWHIEQHNAAKPQGPQLLIAGGVPPNLRNN